MGSYFVDWVLARLDENGELAELTAIEVQTIDTTGSYGTAQKALAENREIISDTAGLNWESLIAAFRFRAIQVIKKSTPGLGR